MTNREEYRDLERERLRLEASRYSRESLSCFGYGRPLEQQHDDGVRATYDRMCRDIRFHGGRVLSVRNELQIKRDVGARVAKESSFLGYLPREKQAHIAEELGLRVVDGRIRIPDLEVIVERKTGDIERLLVEFASKYYHKRAMGVKRRAGFVVSSTAVKVFGRRPENGRDILMEILR